MRKSPLLAVPLAVAGITALAGLALALPANAAASTSTYQATLDPVALNTPSGAASGTFTLTLNGDQATVTEHVTGLADTLPTDTATLNSLGIPAAFAGKPFPHVQHIHINGNDQCPTSSADTNGDGVISTVEGQPAYGMIGTTLSTSGATDTSTATDVTLAPGGGSFTYQRTFTINQATLTAIQDNKAVVVVHGLNPVNAPKASLTTPNSLGVTLPGASKPLALIGTAPALCGVLTASQMSAVPVGSSPTGGGSTAGIQDEALLGLGGGLLLAAGGAFAIRRRSSKG
ncbi:MAG: hypothetical protein EPN43_13010 [Jatrophihabitans sp.]|nr:MAG: hypothetical protein EPN43_13010 [Jatrophihabitans sp.]